MWLNDKEEEEVNYDWSERNTNMGAKKENYSVSIMIYLLSIIMAYFFSEGKVCHLCFNSITKENFAVTRSFCQFHNNLEYL